MQMQSFISLDKRIGLIRFIFKSSLIATFPALLIVYLTQIILSFAGIDDFIEYLPRRNFSYINIFISIIISPLIETLLLAALLKALSFLKLGKNITAAISGCIFGIIHALTGPLMFPGTAWVFCIFSYSFISWKESGFKYSYIAGLAPHILNNAIAWAIVLVATRI